MDKKQLKIMFIGDGTFPIPAVRGGAIETLITNLIEINEEKHELDIIIVSAFDEKCNSSPCYKYTKIYYRSGDIFYSIPSFSLKYKLDRIIFKLKKKLFNNRFTYRIFRTKNYDFNYFTFMCKNIAKLEKVNKIILETSGDFIKYSSLSNYIGEHNLYYHLHWDDDYSSHRDVIRNVICISDFLRKKWLISNKCLSSYVLYNGIKLEDFDITMDNKTKSKIREGLGLSKDDFVVFYCGRIIEVKGIRQLLDAFDGITNHKVKLLIAGSPNYSFGSNDPFFDYFTSRIKNMNNVIYLNYVSHDILPQYYHISDVQIVPSIWEEGAGLVCIEGMVSKLPLIVTNSGGMIEYVNSGCAIILERDEYLPCNIINKIELLYNDPELRERMGNCGYKRSKLFSREKFYDNFVDIVK